MSASSYYNMPTAMFNDGLGISFYHVLSRKSVSFPAFMTAFNETYNCNWNSETIYGRGDPIHTYKNTTRAITIGFKMPAASGPDGYTNLKKLQSFLQFLYAGYERFEDRVGANLDNIPSAIRERAYEAAGITPGGPTNLPGMVSRGDVDRTLRERFADAYPVYTIAQSPLVRLKVMNLTQDNSQIGGDTFATFFANSGIWDPSKGLLGYIKNVSINHNLASNEGVIQGGGTTPMDGPGPVATILPKLIEVQVDFVAIHEHHQGWNPLSRDRADSLRDLSRTWMAVDIDEDTIEHHIEGNEEYVRHSPYGLRTGANRTAVGVRDWPVGEMPWSGLDSSGLAAGTLDAAIGADLWARGFGLPDTELGLTRGPYNYGPEPGTAAADAQDAENAAAAAAILGE